MTTSKYFYDGCNIKKYASHPSVVGFTMNSTFIKQSGFPSYSKFMNEYANDIAGRPISLQVLSDDTIDSDARALAKLGSNVYVKVPVINSKGELNLKTIKTLLDDGIKINITCVFTKEQVLQTYNVLSSVQTPYIVSIFAGGISDTGLDPLPFVQFAVDVFRKCPAAEILWAGVKDNFSVKNSSKIGCHIITIPDSVMDRLGRLDLDLHQMSIDKTKLFNNDATNILIA